MWIKTYTQIHYRAIHRYSVFMAFYRNTEHAIATGQHVRGLHEQENAPVCQGETDPTGGMNVREKWLSTHCRYRESRPTREKLRDHMTIEIISKWHKKSEWTFETNERPNKRPPSRSLGVGWRLHEAKKDETGDESSLTKLNTLHRRRRRFVDLPDEFINWF